MLNWAKIDNDKTFQRLISHLVSVECHTSGFLPSSPYIGADGGYDTYIDIYPNENLKGHICIQAKFTKHSQKEAYEYLRGEVKKELNKAKKNKIDHLIIATNAELSVPYIKKIEKINTSRSISLSLWDREKLTIKIEQQPFLRTFFFNHPSIPLFVPASIYFTKVEGSLTNLADHQIKIRSIQDRIVEINAFARNEEKRIFIIHAPGGYGKSHLLREIASNLQKENVDREVWFIRDGVRDFKEAFGDEIGSRESATEKHKYLFVLDDADRADDIKEILVSIFKSGIDAKIIISLRTSGMFALDDILLSVKCKGLTEITCIPQWKPEELKILLRAVTEKDKIDDEDDIVRKYPNPFFIVRIGLNIKGKGTYKFETLKAEVLQSLLSDAKKALSSESIDVRELLLHLALITPINIENTQTICKLALRFSVDEKRICIILKKLEEGCVLRSIGTILRFIPDMIGDLYLLEKMGAIDEDTRKQVFLYWFDTHSSNIYCNLGATLWYGDKSCLVPIVEDVISGWTNNADKYDSFKKKNVLDNLVHICQIEPNRTLDLLWEYLDSSNLTTDDFGPVIVRLIYTQIDRAKMVKLIEEVRARVPQGIYDNYKPKTLAKEMVSPISLGIENQIMPVLSIIEESIKNNGHMMEFAQEVLKKVLAASHQWTRYTYSQIITGSSFLLMNDSVLAMRNKALAIIKVMLKDDHPDVRLSAIDVINHIGDNPLPTQLPDYVQDRISKEQQELFSFIKSNALIDKEKDLKVLSAYEDLLLIWWARQEIADTEVLPVLLNFSYDPKYIVYRYYLSRWDISEDIREKLKSAPSEDRWKWAVHNIMIKKLDYTVEDFRPIVLGLEHTYSTPALIARFLNELGNKVAIFSSNALFLRAWFQQNPEAFKEIRKEKALWSEVPLEFKYTITCDLIEKYPEMAKQIISEVLLSQDISLEESKIAINILTYDLPSVDKLGIIKTIAAKRSNELNLAIIERIRFIGDKIPVEQMADMVLAIMSNLDETTQDKSIDNIGFILYSKSEEYVREFVKKTGDIVSLILKNKANLDDQNLKVVELFFKDIKGVMGFIEARLEREREEGARRRYEAIPYQGIPFLNKMISSIEDYSFVIEKALFWSIKYEGTPAFYVSIIFKQIVLMNNCTGKLYLEDIKNRFFVRDQFRRYLCCLSHLPLNELTIHLFEEAIQESVKFDLENEMGDVLRNKTIPEGGWTSSPGEVPLTFIKIKELFQQLRKTAPLGKLGSILDQCVDDVERMIQDYKREEENRFYSR